MTKQKTSISLMELVLNKSNRLFSILNIFLNQTHCFCNARGVKITKGGK